MYQFAARDLRNQLVTGVLKADSEQAAIIELVQRKNLTIVAPLTPVKDSDSANALDRIVRMLLRRDAKLQVARTSLWRLLRQASQRGKGPDQAFQSALEADQNAQMSAALRDMLNEIDANGVLLPDVLARHPDIFRADQIGMIRESVGRPTFKQTLTALIEDERQERSEKTAALTERLDSYITYCGIFISLIVLAKVYVRPFAQSNTTLVPDANINTHNLAFVMLAWLGAVGDIAANPAAIAAIIFAASVLIGIYRHYRSAPESALAIEAFEWRILPAMKAAMLGQSRIRALQILTDARFVGLNEQKALRNAAEAVPSKTFADMLLKMAPALGSEGQTLESLIAAEPLWGVEIQSFFRSQEDASWTDDAKELISDLREETAATRRLASIAGTTMHALVALGATSAIVIILTLAQLAQLLLLGGTSAANVTPPITP